MGTHLQLPDRVSYLVFLLEKLGSQDLFGVRALEATLAQFGTSLYDAYPEFVAERLDQSCYFSELSADPEACDQKPDSEYRFELLLGDTIRYDQHTVRQIATAGYEVRVSVPSGEAAMLTVRVPQGMDDPELHLSVDGERVDVGTLPTMRNVYTRILDGGDHVLQARLSAVPEDVNNLSQADVLAPIEFQLVPMTCKAQIIAYGPGIGGGPVDGPGVVAGGDTLSFSRGSLDYRGTDDWRITLRDDDPFDSFNSSLVLRRSPGQNPRGRGTAALGPNLHIEFEHPGLPNGANNASVYVKQGSIEGFRNEGVVVLDSGSGSEFVRGSVSATLLSYFHRYLQGQNWQRTGPGETRWPLAEVEIEGWFEVPEQCVWMEP